MIRLALVSDRALVREGLRLLAQQAAEILVVGEAGGMDALAAASRHQADVALLDLDGSPATGAGEIRALHRVSPRTRLLVLAGDAVASAGRLAQILDAGARGHVTMNAPSFELIEAIRGVASGGVYVPRTSPPPAATGAEFHSAATARSRFQELSDREQSVLRSVAQGYSGAEISRSLGISGKTVDAYKRRIQNKLGLSHRTEYVRFGIEAGILRA